MYYQLKSYFKFWLRSSNQHGVHSPFVYDLATKCFYDSTKYPEYLFLKDFRKKLFQSNESIEITDFGEGSRVFKSNLRKVSEIVKNAGITSKRQRLLFRLVRYFSAETILELGTSVGLATAALAKATPSSVVTTVEGCPTTSTVAQNTFDAFSLNNIQLQTKTFERFFAENASEVYHLVYIDGNHNKEKTLQYFKILLKHKTNDTVFIFDDIYWSPAMTEAWEEIRNHSEVTVSIDTFHWGFVFFRKEQQKEHFTIRL
ncbi:O-methyltransferase [Ulvibacter litoralis]|uniref:Methyltransferase domain-containing protein n=1 Tax=Ulvibacter litoralis TaxID=227084 RepID=A0A1G7GU38_9FLAO|nr:class I SAM-dependent methyltransferase [Ulvibacter litoralis]GHC60071.1 O-methyltransferase [Ulvibacter litoralis]SDE91680.1 Methyltransferase domain-containing protein [Ulvibacter litoralis]